LFLLPPPSASASHPPHQSVPYPLADYTDFPAEQRAGYVPPQGTYMPSFPRKPSEEDDLAYGSDASKASALRGRRPEPSSRHASYTSYTSSAAHQYTPHAAAGEARAPAPQYQYSQPPGKIKYNAKPHADPAHALYTAARPDQSRPDVRYNSAPAVRPYDPLPRTYSDDNYDRERGDHLPRAYSDESYLRDHGAQVVEITPDRGAMVRKTSSTKPHRPYAMDLPPPPPIGLAPQDMGPRLARLSISGNRPDMQSLGCGGAGLPPPSPMLEAYRGTYQSISPSK
jgi:hypothetical protein